MALLRIFIALLLCAMTAVQAQDDLTGEPSEIRRYTVEIIIFRYAQDVSTGSEEFNLEKPAEPNLEPGDEPVMIDGEVLEEIELVSRIYRDIEFTLLPEYEFTLDDIASRLGRLDAYEPLMHFAWTQATWPDEGTLPIELSMMGQPPTGLSGTLRLYLSRFLHLVVDLELEAPRELARPGVGSEAMLNYGDYRSLDESGSLNEPYDFGTPLPVRYHIDENRIFKSGELRYFDHPKFGVLAKVMRVENEPEELPEPSESELLGYPAQ
ncbi:MAG: peptidoglycan binding protein CsiV [Gammaproteobacteria bacterium]|nr:peptidoglycan binding protein CsiV [Gammaproteobacteria bacterium]